MSLTIFQTTSLRSLIIEVHGPYQFFSVSAVMSWLLHTRNSLQEFRCDAYTDDPLNIVEICGCEKLEKLTLAHGVIEGVNPYYPRFSALRSLSVLKFVDITEHDWNALLSVCPKLESLELYQELYSEGYGPFENLEVVAPPNMRRLSANMTRRNELKFESDSHEHLDIDAVYAVSFKFIGKGTLKSMRFKNVVFRDLEIRDSAESLETVEIVHAKIPRAELYRFIRKSSKLRELKLWNVSCSEATDLETIAIHCPQLSSLAVGYGDYLLEDHYAVLPYTLGRSARFEHVLYLEVGWSKLCSYMEEFLDEFFDFTEGLIERCPSLRQLVIVGVISDLEDLKDFPRLSTPIYRILGKCIDSNVRLGFHMGSVDLRFRTSV